jgi:hypothetical protein
VRPLSVHATLLSWLLATYYSINCHMFRPYDHLQAEIYLLLTTEIKRDGVSGEKSRCRKTSRVFASCCVCEIKDRSPHFSMMLTDILQTRDPWLSRVLSSVTKPSRSLLRVRLLRASLGSLAWLHLEDGRHILAECSVEGCDVDDDE